MILASSTTDNFQVDYDKCSPRIVLVVAATSYNGCLAKQRGRRRTALCNETNEQHLANNNDDDHPCRESRTIYERKSSSESPQQYHAYNSLMANLANICNCAAFLCTGTSGGRIKETWLVNEWMSFHEAKRAINPSDKLHRSNVYSDEAEAASFRKDGV